MGNCIWKILQIPTATHSFPSHIFPAQFQDNRWPTYNQMLPYYDYRNFSGDTQSWSIIIIFSFLYNSLFFLQLTIVWFLICLIFYFPITNTSTSFLNKRDPLIFLELCSLEPSIFSRLDARLSSWYLSASSREFHSPLSFWGSSLPRPHVFLFQLSLLFW